MMASSQVRRPIAAPPLAGNDTVPTSTRRGGGAIEMTELLERPRRSRETYSSSDGAQHDRRLHLRRRRASKINARRKLSRDPPGALRPLRN